MSIAAPAACPPHLSLGITGHRSSHELLAAGHEAVERELEKLFDRIDAALRDSGRDLAPARFHSLLVDGVDQLTARMALARNWELVAPLPFGNALNIAINAEPVDAADARKLVAGEAAGDPQVEARAQAIRDVAARAHLFELADRDAQIADLFVAMLEAPGDFARTRAFQTQASDQVALAGGVMLERCDLLIAVWDGEVANLRGGTGHTIVTALDMGTPVLILDPRRPQAWAVLTRPEELLDQNPHVPERLDAVIAASIGSEREAGTMVAGEHWHGTSSRPWNFYRRIEALFGGERPFRSLSSRYETPDEIVTGSAAGLLAAARGLPRADGQQIDRIASAILPQFAWADGISSWLSDAYRSGMCYNFILSALAVVIGAAYLPGDLTEEKWVFASVELVLLLLIIVITVIGGKRRWHERWFETRRVAEYLRHGPIMLLLGASRPLGRWPRGQGARWPENFARHCLRSTGLPRVAIDRDYLRHALLEVLQPHVVGQRDYHRAKAGRLHEVHHRLDKLAETLFILAIISVSIYLLLKLGAIGGIVPHSWPAATSKLFTFLGIAFPTLGASIAGIRFFGDFERFAAISQVAAEKLDELASRIDLLLAAPERAMTYAAVSEMAHAIDDVVFEEVESWQAVFGGKHLALPA